MSSAETAYTFPNPYPDMLQVGRNVVVSQEVRFERDLVEPTGDSTFSLYAPDGTAIVDEAAVTITGSVATYTLTAATHLTSTRALGEGYQEVWTLHLPDGTVRTVDREAALVKRPLQCPISDSDLEDEYPDLPATRGALLTSMQPFIDAAWKRMLGRLIAEGHLPYLVKSSHSFRVAAIELTFGLFFRFAAKSHKGRGDYLELATEHMKAYERAWSSINFTVDADHDGRVDNPNARTGSGVVVYPSSAPDRRLKRSGRW